MRHGKSQDDPQPDIFNIEDVAFLFEDSATVDQAYQYKRSNACEFEGGDGIGEQDCKKENDQQNQHLPYHVLVKFDRASLVRLGQEPSFKSHADILINTFRFIEPDKDLFAQVLLAARGYHQFEVVVEMCPEKTLTPERMR